MEAGMSENNVWKRWRASMFARYEAHDYITQQRAWFLYLFCMVMVCLIIILVSINILLGTQNLQRIGPLIAIMGAVSIGGIFLIRAGKYTIAANTLYVICSLGLASQFSGITVANQTPVFIMMTFSNYPGFMCGAILFATMFCERKHIAFASVFF